MRNPYLFLKPFSTTGIGSLPHRDPEQACDVILKTFDIPFWPQLPRLSYREWMIPQYSEGMPFVRINPEKELIWVDRRNSEELERFYESYTENCKIAMSEDYAKGLHTFIRKSKRNLLYVKGHVTGPLTFTLGLKDIEGAPIYYDEELREIALMLLKAKIRWQMDLLKQFAEKVIIFIDEPVLSAIGSSAYLGVSPEEILRLLTETVDTIKNEGGMAGVHCCGNADWSLVLKSGIDIMNFDAYGYFDNILAYADDIDDFFDRGGFLAWGMIPTTDAIADETYETIKQQFGMRISKLTKVVPSEHIFSQLLLTPSCGTGSRTIEETLRIFRIMISLKETFSA